jgi:hypothetical protein
MIFHMTRSGNQQSLLCFCDGIGRLAKFVRYEDHQQVICFSSFFVIWPMSPSLMSLVNELQPHESA